MNDPLHARYRAALDGEPRPLAFVDLDAFEANIDRLLAPISAGGKRLRVASKSLRCLDLLRRVAARSGAAEGGVMAYTAPEAEWLVEQGVTDLLLAYPTAQPSDQRSLARANATGASVAVVVDSAAQLLGLAEAARSEGTTIPIVVELDVSRRHLGGRVHLGGRRSPLHDAASVIALARDAEERAGLRFAGVMAYEGHIAGVQDDNPFTPLMNGPKRWLKRLDRGRVEALRRAVAEGLEAAGLGGRILNGGGTGSVRWTSQEPCVTEVSAGSGFLAPALFDYYAHLQEAPLTPALGFSLAVARVPGPGLVTAHGGGWVASGEAGPDKLPVPWLPGGMRLLTMEGAGEVQTPLRLPVGVELAPGDPVFFRPAKSGELAEHVREYLLIRGERIEDRVPTYRGAGQCFLG